MQMVYCESCGAANTSDAQQCFACHRSLTDQEPAVAHSEQSSATNEEEFPTILDKHYKVLACVGIGGFGAVYKARALQDNGRLVAIKEIRLRNLKPQEIIEATDSFNREVQILSTLSHPNLPHVYTHFTDPDHWYLVMDFIEGQTLEAYLQANGGKIAQDEVLAIGSQLCDVLSYLHTREPAIIFRDLKPSNVMLSLYRQVYLIDFGTARLFKPGRPRDTIAFGSPGYAAPEQYGKAQTTPRSDIYSLGALLHQMLTGLDPAEAAFQFAPLRKHNPNIPNDLEQLIMRMLEQEADKRPTSAAEVKEALERLSAGQWRRLYAQPGTLSSPIYQTDGSFGQHPPASWATSTPSLAQVQQQLGIPVTPSSANPTTASSKVSRRAITGAIVVLGVAGSAGLLNLVKFPAAFPPRHGHPPGYPQPVGSTYNVYKGHKDSVSSVVWSHMISYQWKGSKHHTGTYIASASFDQTVQIWEATTGHRKMKFTAHALPIQALSCSPDGRFLASADEQVCYVWNPLTGQICFSHALSAGTSPALSWSPDSHYLAIAKERAAIYRITMREQETKATAQLTTTYKGHEGRVNCIAWSPNNDGTVATGGVDGTIQLWDSKTGKHRSTYASPQASAVNALAWSPDSRRIASAHDNRVLIWDSIQQILLATYKGHPSSVTALAWSPSSDMIASASTDNNVHIWKPEPDRAQFILTRFIYTEHTGPVRTVTWASGGDAVASGGDDRTVRIWRG